jgi:hypothetical protein
MRSDPMIRPQRLTALVAATALLFGVVPSLLVATPSVAVTGHSSAMCGTRSVAPRYKHVILIVDENHSFGSIYNSASAPFINRVIAACGVATNYHNVTHPSLPNYLALTSGVSTSKLGPYFGDCPPTSCSNLLGSNNLFHEVATKGWMSFEESMPHACDRSGTGSYASKHNPAEYFTDLKRSCSRRDVALGSPKKSALLSALSSERTAPAFSFVTPNLCDDMHDCTVGAGDTWLQTWLPLITASRVYKNHDTAVFIVWDEGEPSQTAENCAANTTDQSCHVTAIAVAPSVVPGTKVSTSFTHYSLLKTVEDLLHVPELGNARSATSMVAGFNL